MNATPNLIRETLYPGIMTEVIPIMEQDPSHEHPNPKLSHWKLVALTYLRKQSQDDLKWYVTTIRKDYTYKHRPTDWQAYMAEARIHEHAYNLLITGVVNKDLVEAGTKLPIWRLDPNQTPESERLKPKFA